MRFVRRQRPHDVLHVFGAGGPVDAAGDRDGHVEMGGVRQLHEQREGVVYFV
jgi:hypothetical protein